MPWPQNRHKSLPSLRAIKVLVVWWVLLNQIPQKFGQKKRDLALIRCPGLFDMTLECHGSIIVYNHKATSQISEYLILIKNVNYCLFKNNDMSLNCQINAKIYKLFVSFINIKRIAIIIKLLKIIHIYSFTFINIKVKE